MLSQNDPNRPRPLSSQPKRKWGDSDDSQAGPGTGQARSSSIPEFQLTASDWPPSPPRAVVPPVQKVMVSVPKQDGFTRASVTSKSVRTNPAASASFNQNNNTRPSTSTSSTTTTTTSRTLFSSQSKSTPSQSYAPLFQSASSVPSSSSFPPPKKRKLPWEDLSSVPSRPFGTSANFQKLEGGGSKTISKKDILKNSSVNIKQKVVLSPEQQIVLKLVVDDGKNVFFTGSAGTGKSVLLREIISSLRLKYKNGSDAVAITASTGMAACNIGGTTIHSFAGIGLGSEDAGSLVSKIRKNRNATQRWMRCKVLIVDEVSMVDGHLFDKLAFIATALKKDGKSKPFGGIQLIVTGDFFQLPPVTKGNALFAFEAKSWKQSIHHTVNLRQVFRQKDTTFIDMLNEMRFGTLSESSISRFKRLNRVPVYNDGIDPTELFPRREDVDRANQSRLHNLPGPPIIFRADDWPAVEPGRTNTYLENFMAPRKLELKIGAQVMLVKNLNENLVNGTIGKVIGFGNPEEEFEEQGSDGEDRKPVLKKKKDAELGPYIEWDTPNGKFRQEMGREKFEAEDNKRVCVARRVQYPLILAWAMSIHKSQGQTLPRVKVDLTKVFEKGQSYVALSRATCLDGLQIIGFEKSKVAAHPKVTEWSKNLEVLS